MGDIADMNYKIVFIPILGDKTRFEQEFATQEEAKTALEAISLYTLFLHESNIMEDYSNWGFIYMREGTDWVEIDDDADF